MVINFWNRYVAPILRRPPYYQSAALCYRLTDTGPEVLLVTSRDTGRWILPKGWPQSGKDAAGTALEEAWEEAGIKQRGPRPVKVGSYRYIKRLKGGIPAPTQVDVFMIEVVKLLEDYPESSQRKRQWMSPEDAARSVDEEDLAALLRDTPALIRGQRAA